MEETPPPSKTSDENSWPVTEDQSSSRDGSRRRPDWNTRESLKCKDTSEWPSWECSQGNKDIQKGDTLDTEVLASADSSFEEQRGRGRLRETSRDGGWNGSAKRHSEISKRNSWHVTKDHLSSRNGHSCRWRGCDALDSSKCKDDSGWPSWECSQEKKDTHNDDTVDREVHTVSNYTFDEQRGQSKIWKRGRSRSRQREYSISRSRSPCNGPRQASCRLFEKGSVSEKTSRRCRDFAAGKCSRGSQCKFLHQGYLNSRHRDHPRNELTEKSKFRSDDRGTLQLCDYKGSASGPCDEFSDNCKDYCEEVESRKDVVCWKKSLDGKCLRKESCIYSHHRSSGEEYDRRNERIAYDQNDCRFSHDVGRVTTGFLDAAKTKRCDEDCSLDRPKANHYGRGEDEIKSEKCSAWDKFAGVSEKPKDTTGWGKWPGKPDNWNSSSHDSLGGEKKRLNQKSLQHETKLSGRGEDEIKSEKCSAWDKFAGVSKKPKDTTGWDKWPGKPENYIWNSNSQSKRWDGRSKGNICSQDLSEVKKQIDDNILRNSVTKSGKRNDFRSNEKLSERDKLIDLNMPVDREKAMGQGKDKTESWTGPTCDKDWSLNRPKAKLFVWAENVKKSENGSTWDSERPKDTSSRDNWPAWPDSSNANSNSHDPQNKTNMDFKMLANKEKAKLCEWGENMKKSENGLAWDKFSGVSERPKDATSWDNWPAWPDSSNGNSNTHDPQRKRRDCRSEGNIYSQDLRDAKKQAYDNILYNSVKKSSERADPGRHEKFSEREEFLQSHLRNGAANSTNMDLKMLVNKEMAMGQKKDMTNLWNAPTWGDEGCSLDRPRDNGRDGTMIGKRDPCIFADIEKHTGGNIAHNLNDGKKSPNQWDNKKNSWNPKCDDSTCFLDNTEASGWGGSMSINDRHSHDPVDEEKPSQNNIVKTDCEMTISGQDNKVVGKDEYRPPHMLNGREGVDKDTGNLLASKKIFYRKENQIEAQGSEPGGFIFPPSSLMELSQSSHALSPNPSNGFNVILDKSVKYKLSTLVNQMQNQFEEALKILETWACHNSITADQALRLSKLQAYLSENGVHAKSNDVLEKLKMEYVESSATILKHQEPVGYTELNQKTLMVENVSGNNSKGEQCKKDEEIIQSVGADARCEAGESKQDEKSTWLFKNALVKLVKEILNPIWMQGQMKKEVHNTIVKKAVDKVISTEGVNIPRTQEHTEQYLSFSKPQISALINDYVVFFKIQADSS